MPGKIVVVGSCMIDFTCYAPRLPKPGETICGYKSKIKLGGKGANQCVAAAKLGSTTALISALGCDFFAKNYLDALRELHVDTSFVKVHENADSGKAHITVAKNGENSIVIIPGANDLISVEQVKKATNLIENASVLLCQFESPIDATLQALRIHQGHGYSIVNGAPAIKSVNPEIFSLCDIFCVNETEAEVLTGIYPVKISNADLAVNSLLGQGCKSVIITLGSSGAVFGSNDTEEIIQVNTVSVCPVDTTGAGDAFLGALAFFLAYCPHFSMKECIERACKIATLSVLKEGTHDSFPKRDELPSSMFK
ncbi:PREDICTED: ribokinase-like [Polistes dominula]|uniref:Ribokinase n=1 Tax=Polistes dominula TaxID=743375 RepID=A0ABM1ICD5_POLDO|nr:PREDICTED: ribokinase-like [Polistes dominula]XP_015177870.1 PREDICTED: ribokinase-like [Polistes dominula]XP_015177871.1 PREDICTED: ribokinase-like [Polistes dominula]XP_015177872.1 PREDICTED: ribokinase-like [Polistes dominula]